MVEPATDDLAAERPVAFHVNGFGDRLMALPAARALASMFPGRLTVVGGAGDRSRFYLGLPLREVRELTCERVDEVRRFDARALADSLDCDLLISFNTWKSPDMEELLALWPRAASLGFFHGFRTRFRIDYERHACDNYFDLAQHLRPDLRLADFSQPPTLPEAAVESARSIRGRLPRTARLLTLHTETAAEKRWPVDRLQGVLDSFLDRRPEYIVLVVDLAELPTGSMRHAGRVLSLAGLPLSHAMALVAASDLFLGVDSCMLHAADFHRVPGVGLFGPTSPRRWGFRFGPHRHLTVEGAVDRIEAAEVLSALESLAP